MQGDVDTPAATVAVQLADTDLDLLEEGGFQILSALMSHPSTVKQLSIELGLSRPRVKFIIDKLLQRKMISIYQERHEEGRLENYYTAEVEDVSLQIGARATPHMRIRGAQLIIQSLQANALKALASSEPAHMVAMKLVQCQMSREKASEFVARLEALVSEFDAAEDTTAEEVFALAFMLYPVFTDQGD